MKAVWFSIDEDGWRGWYATCPGMTSRFLLEAAFGLDKRYIPTRYPDALADLTPGESYTESEARAAIEAARAILERVRGVLAP